MPTKKDLSKMTEEEYCEELNRALKHLLKFYEDSNDADMPCLLCLPHKYGVASVRKLPSDLEQKARVRMDTKTLSYPLTNAIAFMLDMVKADKKFTGQKAVMQMLNDQVAYEVLTVLLAELLVGDRIEDNLELRKCLGMRQAMAAVEELHGMTSDDDDEDCDCEECNCEKCEYTFGSEEERPSYQTVLEGGGSMEVCVKADDGLRGYSLDIKKISPEEYDEVMTLVEDNAKLGTTETADKLEKFMHEHGATCVPAEKCVEQIKKIVTKSCYVKAAPVEDKEDKK